MSQVPTFSPGERLAADKLNQLAAIAGQAWNAVRRTRGPFQDLANRVRLCAVYNVTVGGVVFSSVLDVPTPGPAETVTYDVVEFASGRDPDVDLTPKYGRPAAPMTSNIIPARVGDVCFFIRDIDEEGTHTGRLWILTEKLEMAACEDASPAQQREALLEQARLVAMVGFEEGIFAALAAVPADAEAQRSAAAPDSDDAGTPATQETDMPQDVIIDLSQATCRQVFELPSNVRGVAITAIASEGTWTEDLDVEIEAAGAMAPAVDVPFATPKLIEGGGPADEPVMVQITESELAGVNRLVVKRAAGTDEAAKVRILLGVTTS